MWFTVEKLFTVTPPVNLQNDRVYVAVPMRKKQVAANRLLRTRSNFSKSIMVSVVVSSLGCTELIFINPGVKVNGAKIRENTGHHRTNSKAISKARRWHTETKQTTQ